LAQKLELSVTKAHEPGRKKTDKIRQACSSFYVLQATLAKFALHVGSVKLST
jgi:hypothetical protein